MTYEQFIQATEGQSILDVIDSLSTWPKNGGCPTCSEEKEGQENET